MRKDPILLIPRKLGTSLWMGPQLGALLRAARGNRSPAEIAAASGVSLEALRKIESGRVPTPAFFTVAALAAALDVPLDQLVAAVAAPADAALTA